jgi:uncharacterized membrane protein
MAQSISRGPGHQVRTASSGPFDMEVVVGYILLVGVLVSMVLVAAGLTWHWAATGHLGLEYSVAGMNLFEFVRADIRQVAADAFRPRLLVNLGIAVLLLTPYARVFASMVYFAFVAHNRKYTIFTGFVFAVLTYSLFLQ